jgi:phosphoglycolate phosphatase
MTRALLLDLDGTLIDSRPGIVASIFATLREFGHEPDTTMDLTWAIGPPLGETIPRIFSIYGDDRGAAAVAVYRRHYAAGGLFNATLYPGIAELLAAAATEFDLVLATSKRRDFASRILDHFGLSSMFRGVYGSEPGGALDHKPELLAHLLRRERIFSSAAVMVGDRHYDVEGARANGMRVIGVTWGYGSADELEHADALAHTAAEVLPLARGLLQNEPLRK